jgi:proteasome lid subunit RPN8/RPN11
MCHIIWQSRRSKNHSKRDISYNESPVNFTISNEQLIKCYKTAEEKKMEVVGIFHSHPNSEAYPSNTDKKFMHSNPVAWVIYSGISNKFKAYVLESNVLEILIET